MSQINPYPSIVVPDPRPSKTWPRKQGQGKSQHREQEEPKKEPAKEDGEGIDVKA